jgi:hypothetical protein
MTSLFQPDPIILAFIAAKQGIYLLLLLPLVLVRSLAAAGRARAAGQIALMLCLAGLAARYLPEMLGVYQGPAFRAAGAWRGLWGGLGMNLAASAALLVSAVLPGRRWWGIDAVHLLLLAGLFGLWVYSRV